MNENDTGLGFATRAIHMGKKNAAEQGALVPQIYMTSTFTFENAEQGAALFAGEEKGHFLFPNFKPNPLITRRMHCGS